MYCFAGEGKLGHIKSSRYVSHSSFGITAESYSSLLQKRQPKHGLRAQLMCKQSHGSRGCLKSSNHKAGE